MTDTFAMLIDGPANGMVVLLHGRPSVWEVCVPSRMTTSIDRDHDPTAPAFARCQYQRLPRFYGVDGLSQVAGGSGDTTPSGYTLYVWDGRRR